MASNRKAARKPRRNSKPAQSIDYARMDMGERVALDTPSHRRGFQTFLRDQVGNPNSPLMTGIRKLQAERSAARAEPLVRETVNAFIEHAELAKAVNNGEALTAEKHKRHVRLSGRFAGLMSYGPTAAQVHIDTALTSLMATYGNGDYIADEVLPPVTVSALTGKVFKRLIQDVQRGEEYTARAPGLEAGEIEWGMDTAVSYAIVEYKAKKGLPDSIAQTADAPIDVDEITAQDVMNVLRAGREIRVATLLQTAGSYASGNQVAAPSVKWDAANTADNEHWTDIQAAFNAISDNTGAPPTDIIVPKRCALALISKDHFREATIYVEGALPLFLLNKIAAYCMVDRAHVPFGRKTTTNPGQSTQTQGDIWSDAPVMLTVGSPSTMYVGLGISPSTAALAMAKYRDPIEDRERNVIWGKQAIDEVILNNKSGAILQDVLT